MDYYDFVASAIAAVASLYNANAELAHLQKIGVKDVCVLWCGSTLQNNKAWLSTTVPDCMYYHQGTQCHCQVLCQGHDGALGIPVPALQGIP